MIKWFVEKIYHYSTYLTSWSWTWLYGKRKVVTPKGMLRMSKTRVHYYKSLISYDKRDNIVEQIISCLLYTSPSPRDGLLSRMPSSA